MRAEAAGEQRDGVRLLHEEQLAREEVVEVHQLRIAADDRVGGLLEGQADVDAEAVLAPGAALAGLHDAAAGAGDDHEAALGDGARERLGGAEHRVVLLRARRAEGR